MSRSILPLLLPILLLLLGVAPTAAGVPNELPIPQAAALATADTPSTPDVARTDAPAHPASTPSHPNPAPPSAARPVLLPPQSPPEGKLATDQVGATLARSAQIVATPNLRTPEDPGVPVEPDAKFEQRLALGRMQMRERDYANAEKSLSWIVVSRAPDDLKRAALLELALLAQETQQFAKAQQIYAQYVKTYPEDPAVPDVLLRQGLVFRQMGAPNMALSRFYSVFSAALNLQGDRLEAYKRVVLHAQSEIAETYYLQGKSAEAADYFSRLLKLEAAELNKPQIHYKLVRCLSSLERHPEVVAQAGLFLNRHATSTETPEVRYLLADSLRRLGRHHEAREQVLVLLTSQQATAATDPQNWAYWQLKTGNDIANQLYRDGDYMGALDIYLSLAQINPAAAWQLPVWYQAGLVFERLQQPHKASELYTRILARETEVLTNRPSPSLTAVIDMARWRQKNIAWQDQAELATRSLLKPADPFATLTVTNALAARP